MELIDIIKSWRVDSEIQVLDLGGEALKIPKLHCKYYEILIREKLMIEKQKGQLKQLELVLFEYYSGLMPVDEAKKLGLEQLDYKILKPEVPRYIEAHKDVIELKKKIAEGNEKVEFLKSILDHIKGRSFIIRDAIEWEKFKQGA